MAVLKSHALDHYFLLPSNLVGAQERGCKRRLARKLNIGLDTLMLIDDSEFELAQVRSMCPETQLFAADRYQELPSLPMFQVPVTTESANRRSLYQQESVREAAAEYFGGEYLAFLRDCQMEMQIEPLSAENIERVHEIKPSAPIR